MQTPLSGRGSVNLKGELLSFNISLAIVQIACLALFYLSAGNANLIICYGGTGIAAVGLISSIAYLMYLYSRRDRPVDSSGASISFEHASGNKVAISDVPDKLLTSEQISIVIRQMLVGYDENICPDGEVIGSASESKYREYTDEERRHFKQDHARAISGRKHQIKQILEQEESSPSATLPEDFNRDLGTQNNPS